MIGAGSGETEAARRRRRTTAMALAIGRSVASQSQAVTRTERFSAPVAITEPFEPPDATGVSRRSRIAEVGRGSSPRADRTPGAGVVAVRTRAGRLTGAPVLAARLAAGTRTVAGAACRTRRAAPVCSPSCKAAGRLRSGRPADCGRLTVVEAAGTAKAAGPLAAGEEAVTTGAGGAAVGDGPGVDGAAGAGAGVPAGAGRNSSGST